jgi:hypothetical protein
VGIVAERDAAALGNDGRFHHGEAEPHAGDFPGDVFFSLIVGNPHLRELIGGKVDAVVDDAEEEMPARADLGGKTNRRGLAGMEFRGVLENLAANRFEFESRERDFFGGKSGTDDGVKLLDLQLGAQALDQVSSCASREESEAKVRISSTPR